MGEKNWLCQDKDSAGIIKFLKRMFFIYFSFYLIIHFPFTCNEKIWFTFFFFFPANSFHHFQLPSQQTQPRLSSALPPKKKQTAGFGLLDCAGFLHIPPQREAPCFYMNEHGWVVRRLNGETGSICITQERKLLFDTSGMQSCVQFSKSTRQEFQSSCLKWCQMHSVLSNAKPQ